MRKMVPWRDVRVSLFSATGYPLTLSPCTLASKASFAVSTPVRDLLLTFRYHMDMLGVEPTAVTGGDFRIYQEALRKSGQASATIARKLSVIRGTFEQWGKIGFVDWHMVLDIKPAESPRVETNSTPGLAQTEASKLLQAPDTSSLVSKRDHALLFVFFRTACRVSAIAGALVGHAERTDADWYLRVTEKGNKKSRKKLLEAGSAARSLYGSDRNPR